MLHWIFKFYIQTNHQPEGFRRKFTLIEYPEKAIAQINSLQIGDFN